jgi:hypothetical protein
VLLADTTHPAWLYELLPVLVFLVGLGSLALGVRSWFLDRMRKDHAQEDHAVLTEEAVARVMGRAANPARGQAEVIGLVVVVPELQKKIDQIQQDLSQQEPPA